MNTKKYIITGSKDQDIVAQKGTRLYNIEAEGNDDMQVSDGYHTMDELYEHRIQLFISLCKMIEEIDQRNPGYNRVWRSSYHSDGSQFEGWFILGIGREPGKQITYHLPMSRWFDTGFADTLDRAPEWDKHTSADVLERLKNL